MALFRKNKKAEEIINLPRHIGIIMDGNGRWANRRKMPRTAGHAAGAETFRKIATYCKNIGIDYLTVYAFSTENWKRPPEEVSAIMKLLDQYLLEAMEKMERDEIKMCFFGDTSVLSPELQEKISQTNEISKRIDGFQVNICLNYGGRDEIIRAVKKYADEVKNGRENSITESEFSNYLFSAGIPDPDLIIRPSGEYRISNFLMWQSAYSEFYFTDTLWPDFKEKDLDMAIRAYSARDRRFGAVKKGNSK